MANPQTFSEGSFLRAAGTDLIYQVAPGGGLQALSTPEEVRSLGGVFGQEAVIREGDIFNLPGGQSPLTLEPGGTFVPYKAPPAPEFAPEIPSIIPSSEINDALSSPTQAPSAFRTIQEGEAIRAQGAPEVSVLTGGELRPFTSETALIKAGFDPAKVRIVLPDILQSFNRGAPIDEIIAGFLPFELARGAAQREAGIPALQAERRTVFQRLQDALLALPGLRSAIRDRSYQQFSVQEKEAALSVIQNQIATREGEFMTMENELRSQPGVISSIIEGQVSRLRRESLIEMNVLRLKEAALSGQFTRALDFAKTAVAESYDDEQLRIDAIRNHLQFAGEELSTAQQTAAQALTFELNRREEQLKREQELTDQKAQLFLKLSVEFPRAVLSPGMSMDQMISSVLPFAKEREKLDLENTRSLIAARLSSGSDGLGLGTPAGQENAIALLGSYFRGDQNIQSYTADEKTFIRQQLQAAQNDPILKQVLDYRRLKIARARSTEATDPGTREQLLERLKNQILPTLDPAEREIAEDELEKEIYDFYLPEGFELAAIRSGGTESALDVLLKR